MENKKVLEDCTTIKPEISVGCDGEERRAAHAFLSASILKLLLLSHPPLLPPGDHGASCCTEKIEVARCELLHLPAVKSKNRNPFPSPVLGTENASLLPVQATLRTLPQISSHSSVMIMFSPASSAVESSRHSAEML